MNNVTASKNPTSKSASKQSTLPGLVIANYGAKLVVETGDGTTVTCFARKKLGHLVCGDHIKWKSDKDGEVITELIPRISELSRPDKQGRKKVIAANIQQMLIITAPKPAFNPGLIDRYLVAAKTLKIQPVIVLNKTDLLDEHERQELDAQLNIYQSIGYPILHTSTKVEHGLDEIISQLTERSSIFVGQSGVGKSSLINSIIPDAEARVGEISEATSKGTHTTTTTWLYHLPDRPGAVIDSPGVREFGLWQISPQLAASGFIEFIEHAESCRFRNCLHKGEPGCAVTEAVNNGDINQQRYDSYLRILASLEEA